MILKSKMDCSSVSKSKMRRKKKMPMAQLRKWYILCARSLPIVPSHAYVQQVTYKMIKCARIKKALQKRKMSCASCSNIPEEPVSGPCGHIRCLLCVRDKSRCACGTMFNRNPRVDILVRDLIDKIFDDKLPNNELSNGSYDSNQQFENENPFSGPPSLNALPASTEMVENEKKNKEGSEDMTDACRTLSTFNGGQAKSTTKPRVPKLYKARLEIVRNHIILKDYDEAAAHVAFLASAPNTYARYAKNLLSKIIAVMSVGRDPRCLTPSLIGNIRKFSVGQWLKRIDLECIICKDLLCEPVTTTCGHTYCRHCLQRVIETTGRCPLCVESLRDFVLMEHRDNEFITAALSAIDPQRSPPFLDREVIPIVVCTATFPGVSCPIVIFDQSYFRMLCRLLNNEEHNTDGLIFGVTATNDDRSDIYSVYGTLVSVRDCLMLEDGQVILTTIGLSRFKIMERDTRDGCDIARIEVISDETADEEDLHNLFTITPLVAEYAEKWLNNMDYSFQITIESTFGRIPTFTVNSSEWTTCDGPVWLWWLVAILPLSVYIKTLFLSKTKLVKRMDAVRRVLETLQYVNDDVYQLDHEVLL